jgi:hypothetical protein
MSRLNGSPAGKGTMSEFNNPHGVELEQKASGGMKVKGAASVLKKFFGFREGQKLTEFASEVNALSTQDQIDLVGGITSGTLTY